MTGRIIDAWRRLGWTRPRISRAVYYASQQDLPDQIPRRAMVVIGSPEHAKWAVLACPCGRGHILRVPLHQQQRPRWRLVLDSSGPSLKPSVDVREEHRCHFWLTKGRVHWAKDSTSR